MWSDTHTHAHTCAQAQIGRRSGQISYQLTLGQKIKKQHVLRLDRSWFLTSGCPSSHMLCWTKIMQQETCSQLPKLIKVWCLLDSGHFSRDYLFRILNSICVCLCAYEGVCVHVNVCSHEKMYVHMKLCVCSWRCVCACEGVCFCMWRCVWMWMYVCMWICVSMWRCV